MWKLRRRFWTALSPASSAPRDLRHASWRGSRCSESRVQGCSIEEIKPQWAACKLVWRRPSRKILSTCVQTFHFRAMRAYGHWDTGTARRNLGETKMHCFGTLLACPYWPSTGICKGAEAHQANAKSHLLPSCSPSQASQCPYAAWPAASIAC